MKTLIWNDPAPIEGNDYTVSSVKFNNDDEGTAYIEYGQSSTAEVFVSELEFKETDHRVECYKCNTLNDTQNVYCTNCNTNL